MHTQGSQPDESSNFSPNSGMSSALSRAHILGMCALLRQTVVYPWESVDQLLRFSTNAPIGDPLTPSTGAWHLRHIVEIFRQHAHVVLLGLGLLEHEISAIIPTPESPIPANPTQARDALLHDIDAFIACLERIPDATLSNTFTYGKPTNLPDMLACMTLHITWHAAAVHYWCKWKRGDG